MANRTLQRDQGTLEHGIVKIFLEFTIGSSGAIGTSSIKGVKVVKTASKTGRYTITLQDKYPFFKGCAVTLVGPADAGFGTTCGFLSFVRNEAVQASGTFDLQFAGATTSPTDTDLPSGTKVYCEITLKNSTSY